MSHPPRLQIKCSAPKNVRMQMERLLSAACLLFLLMSVISGKSLAGAAEDLVALRPVGVQDLRGERYGTYSERTIAAAFAVDRDQATLISFTLKDRPFVRSLVKDPPHAGEENAVQLEFALLGEGGLRYTQLLDFNGICLEHGPDEAPHIMGDTIRVHRDTVVVEFPEVKGLDRIEVASFEEKAGNRDRKLLASVKMDAAHFIRAGGNASYADLAFAAQTGAAAPPEPETAGTVIWPESLGDPDIYTVFGNAAEFN